MEAELLKLRYRVAELEAQCSEQMARPRIAKMSAEVKDTNPYSRLMALQRMNIVEGSFPPSLTRSFATHVSTLIDYEAIRSLTVAVVATYHC